MNRVNPVVPSPQFNFQADACQVLGPLELPQLPGTVDILTGLMDRAQLMRDVASAPCPVLMLANLDGFSQFNDLFGVGNGDRILRSTAERLKKVVFGPRFSLYRLGADEFAILASLPVSGKPCPEKAEQDIPWKTLTMLAEDLVANIGEMEVDLVDGNTGMRFQVALTLTMGLAVGSQVGRDNLLPLAHLALKAARKERKGYKFYRQSETLQKQFVENIYWAKALKDALQEDRVEALYQPIVNLHSGKTEKYEALIRIREANGHLTSPATFLDVAKTVRLYPQLTRVVLDKALEQFRGPLHFNQRVAINLSILDILDSATMDHLFAALVRTGSGPRVSFELLEQEGIENYQPVREFIDKVRDFGCRVGIDDFGMGYSNFSHVVKLGVDFLKLDGSLIKNLDTDKASRTIVRAITTFAKELEINTIAEFVHSQAVLDLVVELGVDYGQGYYFGKPSPL